MKKLFIAIILCVFMISAALLYDFGYPVSGSNIEMLKTVDVDAGLKVQYLSHSENYIKELNSEQAKAYIEELRSQDYFRITASKYHGSFEGEHLMVYALSTDDHAVTIELCGNEKMSVTDETDNRTEYYRFR